MHALRVARQPINLRSKSVFVWVVPQLSESSLSRGFESRFTPELDACPPLPPELDPRATRVLQHVYLPQERNAKNLTIFQNRRKFLKIGRYTTNEQQSMKSAYFAIVVVLRYFNLWLGSF